MNREADRGAANQGVLSAFPAPRSALPQIVQDEGQIGFWWATPHGVPISLPDLALTDDEPDVLAATHLEALADADPLAVACAIDWLLYDWLMAHRDGPDSGAVEIPKGRESEAGLIVEAAAASVTARAAFDPGLLAVPGRVG